MLRRPNRIIIAQYEPPRDLSLIAAAELLGLGRRAVAAQVIDLAVRHSISVMPRKRKLRRTGFTLRFDSHEGLDADARQLVGVLFPKGLGTLRTISRGSNRRLGAALRAPHLRAIARLVSRGLATRRSSTAIILSPWRRQPVQPTREAQHLIDHLFGLRDYITLAEADRLRFLQSPAGAQLDSGAEGFARALVLNERMLPWAVLFNLEREWSRQLDLHHRDEQRLDGVDLDLFLLDVDALPDALAMLDSLDTIDALSAALNGVGAIARIALGSILDGT